MHTTKHRISLMKMILEEKTWRSGWWKRVLKLEGNMKDQPGKE